MNIPMRQGFVSIVLLVSLAGCHAPQTVVRPGTPSPTVAAQKKDLPAITPGRIEANLTKVTMLDAATYNPVKPAATYKALDEATAQCLGAAHSSTANLLDEENAKPSIITVKKKHHDCPDTRGDDLMRELRRLVAMEYRNKAAAETLDRYVQLADVVARTALARDGLKTFDELRTEVPKLRAKGIPTPDDDDLTRQRAKLIADLITADAGIVLLEHELISKLGIKMLPSEHLWPTGPFDIDPQEMDAEKAVALGLQNRAELTALRTLQRELNEATLPAVREQLRTMNGLLGLPPQSMKLLTMFHPKPPTDAIDEAELATRRRQLADLLASKEGEVEAQVRQAMTQMTAAATKTALLQARAVSQDEKWLKAKAENKTLDIHTARLDLLRADSEVIAAAMEWHQWRIRMRAAQGLLGSECLTNR
ncbi:hypothetical protein BH11PLA2_BH11PLA2_07280 [soil metagenome]